MRLYLARTGRAAALVTAAALAVTLTGCEEESRVDRAAKALCAGWSWDTDADLEQRAHAMDVVLADAGVHVIYGKYGDGADEASFVTERAADYCDTDFSPYLDALDELDAAEDRRDAQGSSADAAARAAREERRELKKLRERQARAEEGSSSGSSDETVAGELGRLGYTRGDVVALGLIADDTGYGLSPGTPLPYDMAENFAYVIALSCRDLARGRTTVGALIDDDVSMGAPPSEADRFWSYVTSRFCR